MLLNDSPTKIPSVYPFDIYILVGATSTHRCATLAEELEHLELDGPCGSSVAKDEGSVFVLR